MPARRTRREFMTTTAAAGAASLAAGAPGLLEGRARRRQDASGDLTLGLIGLDTSHVVAFTELLNDRSRPDHVPGARVVYAYKGGSPDVEASATRIDQFTERLTGDWGVTLVPTIEELCQEVDAVLLTSVDGRVHLVQAQPVIEARKPVFIDKPFTASVRDAREIVRLAREHDTPVFSASSRRYAEEIVALTEMAEVGAVVGASTFGPATIEPHHPDLFWYGIHTVETLYTLLGPGCQRVTRAYTEGADVVTGQWPDGRLGVVRGIREGDAPFGALLFGSEQVVATPSSLVPGAQAPPASDGPSRSSHYGLVTKVVDFLKSGTTPVSPDETVEIMAFMEAAEVSKDRRGAPVDMEEVLQS